MRRHWRKLALALAVAGGVAFTVWRAPDLGDVAAAFRDARWPLAAAALAANLVSVTWHGVAWRMTLRQALDAEPPALRRVLAAHWIGALGNLLFPARAGEAARVGILTRHVEREGSTAALAGSAVAHRLLEAVPVALLVLVVFVTAPVPGWARGLLLGLLGLVAAGLAVAFLAARRGDVGDGRLERLRGGLAVLRAPLPTAAAVAAATLAIAFQLLGLWLVLRAFGLDVPFVAAAVVLLLAELVVVFPLWPGNVGVYQGAVAGGLAAFGVPYTTGLAYALVTQGLDAAAAAATGTAGLAMEGAGLSELRGDGED